MAELADPAADHRGIAACAAELDIELLAVGTELYGIAPVEDLDARLGPLDERTAVLIKASRVAGLERIASGLLAG